MVTVQQGDTLAAQAHSVEHPIPSRTLQGVAESLRWLQLPTVHLAMKAVHSRKAEVGEWRIYLGLRGVTKWEVLRRLCVGGGPGE